jgi:hypothetical protein
MRSKSRLTSGSFSLRRADGIRIFGRPGYHDWTARYPLIVDAALWNRQTRFVTARH